MEMSAEYRTERASEWRAAVSFWAESAAWWERRASETTMPGAPASVCEAMARCARSIEHLHREFLGEAPSREVTNGEAAQR